jgi:glycosyltransferase involved in cell wall biosynthesis
MEKHPKVSMVMPCWNKVKFIGHMLESVYNQTWDNIELIMVNDGATDGSREIIEHWKNKMIEEKGYEVIIIDQENQGICKAVYNGMLKITGEFFCCVDCDDELDPEYVSAMAGFLCENQDYEWVCCDMLQYKDVICDRSVRAVRKMNGPIKNVLLAFLLLQISRCTYLLMTRTAYLRSCRVIEHYVTDYKANQEPGIYLPLAAGGGKLGYIEKPLYCHNLCNRSNHLAAINELLPDFFSDTGILCKEIIAKLDMPRSEKELLFQASKLGDLYPHIELAAGNPLKKEQLHGIVKEFAECVNAIVPVKNAVTESDVILYGCKTYLNAVYYYFTDDIKNLDTMLAPLLEARRVIGVGALGKATLIRLPILLANNVIPDALWDMNAKPESKTMEFTVTKPKYENLSDGDVIVVFSFNKTDVFKRAFEETSDRAAEVNFYGAEELLQLFAASLFTSASKH